MSKHFEEKVDVGLVAKTDVNAEHRITYRSLLTLLSPLAPLAALLLALIPSPLSDIVRVVLLVAAVIMALMLWLNKKMRYSLIMSLRLLYKKPIAEKTYSDKKPANHSD